MSYAKCMSIVKNYAQNVKKTQHEGKCAVGVVKLISYLVQNADAVLNIAKIAELF